MATADEYRERLGLAGWSMREERLAVAGGISWSVCGRRDGWSFVSFAPTRDGAWQAAWEAACRQAEVLGPLPPG
jgi:hypothetical protein